MNYNGYYRVSILGKPSLTCSNPNDRFTVSSNNGNGKLTYKVGLLTLDESMMAGLAWDANDSNSYLSNGKVWWTMTPTLQSSVYMYIGVNHSMLDNVQPAYTSNGAGGVRPVISLNKNMKITAGDGSENNPYKFETEE